MASAGHAAGRHVALAHTESARINSATLTARERERERERRDEMEGMIWREGGKESEQEIKTVRDRWRGIERRRDRDRVMMDRWSD